MRIQTRMSFLRIQHEGKVKVLVEGYLTVMSRETLHIKVCMLNHLQELMEDSKHYGWPVIRACNAAWLQHVEQSWAVWGDEAVKLRLWHALVWHHVVASTDSYQASTAPLTVGQFPPTSPSLHQGLASTTSITDTTDPDFSVQYPGMGHHLQPSSKS